MVVSQTACSFFRKNSEILQVRIRDLSQKPPSPSLRRRVGMTPAQQYGGGGLLCGYTAGAEPKLDLHIKTSRLECVQFGRGEAEKYRKNSIKIILA